MSNKVIHLQVGDRVQFQKFDITIEGVVTELLNTKNGPKLRVNTKYGDLIITSAKLTESKKPVEEVSEIEYVRAKDDI